MIYTFYSYKGGVGRTMALANIADLLRQNALRVIVVDWELEAPDLERYFPCPEAGSHLGLIDLILDFKEIMSQPLVKIEGKDELPLPELLKYLVESPIDDGPPLMLLPAGRRVGPVDFENHAQTVRFFDWKDFYQNWEGELFFKWLRQELCRLADIILINSCPGISEMGSICTQQMANVIVFFCGTNQQSLDGTLKLAADLIGTQKTKVVGEQRMNFIIVPARVEERAEAQLLSDFKQNFIKGCKPFLPPDKASQEDSEYFWNLRVPNVPRFTFQEGLVIRKPRGADEAEFNAALVKIAQAMARLAPPESPLYQLCNDKPIPPAKVQPLIPEGVEPYRGLSPFLEEHAGLFFGRAAEIKELLNYVKQSGLVAVIGPSGSGKSSLVQAGLLPRVRRGDLPGSEHWKIVMLSPGDDPFGTLAAALAPALREAKAAVDNHLAVTLAEEELGLGQSVKRMLAGQPVGARLLLIIDQFEELFTLAPEEQQQTFLLRLMSAIEKSPLTVALTLRSDFYNDCEQYLPFVEAMCRQMVRLDQMSREELKESIIKPAELMGVTFEAGLADRILDDVGTEPGYLPLLQFALARLWDGREGGRLTHQVYAKIGGVQEAVAQRAETVYLRLSEGKRKIARRIFTQLVQLNEGDRNTRRRATFVELGEPANEIHEIVQLLRDARLLVVREAGNGPTE